MSKTDGNHPASSVIIYHGDTYGAFRATDIYAGMTKREAIAIAAMQGLLANSAMIDTTYQAAFVELSGSAVRCADAIIAALNKE